MDCKDPARSLPLAEFWLLRSKQPLLLGGLWRLCLFPFVQLTMWIHMGSQPSTPGLYSICPVEIISALTGSSFRTGSSVRYSIFWFFRISQFVRLTSARLIYYLPRISISPMILFRGKIFLLLLAFLLEHFLWGGRISLSTCLWDRLSGWVFVYLVMPLLYPKLRGD